MNQAELSILDFIEEHLSSSFGDWFFATITHLGDAGIIWIVLAVILTIIPKTRRVGVTIMISLIIESIFCNLLLKPMVARPRPFDVKGKVDLLVAPPTDFSFPSGHTGASFATFFAILFQRSKWWIPTGVIAVLIAFSRLYLYVHYPTDVLCGVLLGLGSGWIAKWFVNHFEDEKERKEESDKR